MPTHAETLTHLLLEGLAPDLFAPGGPLEVIGGMEPTAPEVCLVWRGNLDSKGYPRVRVEGRLEYAHRFVFALANGPIPPSATVRRTCGNNTCVKVSHLALVSRAAPLWRTGYGKVTRGTRTKKAAKRSNE